jgi:hypothetical protein
VIEPQKASKGIQCHDDPAMELLGYHPPIHAL